MAGLIRQAFGATGATWTDAGFTASDFNSRANGHVVVASSGLSNDNTTTEGDLAEILSFEFEVGGTTTTGSIVQVFLLPVGHGGIFGDDAVTGSTLPASSYLVDQVGVKPGVTLGNKVYGQTRPIPLPLGDYKWAIAPLMGAALDSSAAAVIQRRRMLLNADG